MEGWISRSEMDKEEIRQLEHFAISDLFIILLFFIYVLAVQFLLIKPFIDFRAKKEELTIRLTLMSILIFTVVNGLGLGLWFGTFELGITKVLESIEMWLIVFSLFYLTNLITLKKLY